MNPNVTKEVAGLRHLTVPELRARYAEVFGEPTLTKNRLWLVKRLAWRLQALAEGDLPERARKLAAELANDADLRTGAPGCRSARRSATPPRLSQFRQPAPDTSTDAPGKYLRGSMP
jgi:hypothetical protein